MRKKEIRVRVSDEELATIEAAATITHPTDKGANVARFVRESALKTADKITEAETMNERPSTETILNGMKEVGKQMDALRAILGDTVHTLSHVEMGHWLRVEWPGEWSVFCQYRSVLDRPIAGPYVNPYRLVDELIQIRQGLLALPGERREQLMGWLSSDVLTEAVSGRVVLSDMVQPVAPHDTH